MMYAKLIREEARISRVNLMHISGLSRYKIDRIESGESMNELDIAAYYTAMGRLLTKLTQ